MMLGAPARMGWLLDPANTCTGSEINRIQL
jgi:hypothetical protein